MDHSESVTGILRYPHIASKWGAYPDGAEALASTHVLDHGIVALLSTYHSDQMIAETARVSYGKGTKQVKTEAGLIRYLMRHRHTSPFEHAEVTFYLRIPIFVARQLIRHRTANVNEYSARYSELSDDFYVPSPDYLHEQSTTNKQGRGSLLSSEAALNAQVEFVNAQQNGLQTYHRLLDQRISREVARVVTSVGTYTELYWKCDLHNFLHFLKLRMDPHAQQEIRDVATAMYLCATSFFPQTFAAWDDYVRRAYTLSAPELTALRDLLRQHVPSAASYPANTYGMSDREYADFKRLLDTLLS